MSPCPTRVVVRSTTWTRSGEGKRERQRKKRKRKRVRRSKWFSPTGRVQRRCRWGVALPHRNSCTLLCCVSRSHMPALWLAANSIAPWRRRITDRPFCVPVPNQLTYLSPGTYPWARARCAQKLSTGPCHFSSAHGHRLSKGKGCSLLPTLHRSGRVCALSAAHPGLTSAPGCSSQGKKRLCLLGTGKEMRHLPPLTAKCRRVDTFFRDRAKSNHPQFEYAGGDQST